jgi:hypothetical protein
LTPIRSLVAPFVDDAAPPGSPPFWCPTISANPAADGQGTIVGHAVLNQLTTIYDLERQRVGFAANRAVPCDSLLSGVQPKLQVRWPSSVVDALTATATVS